MFKQIGVNIKSIRKSNGLTQSELASRLGITRQQVANYEKGDSSIPLSSIIKMSDIFNISIDNLVKGSLDNPTEVKYKSEEEVLDYPIFEGLINEKKLANAIDNIVDNKLNRLESLLLRLLTSMKAQEAKETINDELSKIENLLDKEKS
ncbi:helix-turn-helix domain-containing protein [Kordia sp. TARA_039_SRF]|nr:helix-turn-helix domain-containing protein [Kordia sp. TARA_039_SRF]